jgi:hypothetical protein
MAARQPPDRADSPKPALSAPPPLGRQKTFIVENAEILDHDAKKAILRLVMMEGNGRAPGGASPDGRLVVLERGVSREVSVDLDAVESPEVILQIYNVVQARRLALDEPVREPELPHAGRW